MKFPLNSISPLALVLLSKIQSSYSLSPNPLHSLTNPLQTGLAASPPRPVLWEGHRRPPQCCGRHQFSGSCDIAEGPPVLKHIQDSSPPSSPTLAATPLSSFRSKCPKLSPPSQLGILPIVESRTPGATWKPMTP